MAMVLKTGRPVRGVEAVAERPDGTRVPFAPYPTPLFNGAGELVGAVNMLMDITHRVHSQEMAQRLASIVQSSDDAIVSKDLSGTIMSWNAGAVRLFGYSAEEAIGKPITMLIPPERADEEVSILSRLRRGERIEHFETVRRRKDGALIDISLTVSPVHGVDGRVIGASKIARDITERRRAQEQQKLLLGEIMHRVKNTLATVQAIASQTLRRAPADERGAFTARLHALSKAHDLLTSDTWDRAPLRAVVASALAPFQRERIALEGPDVVLDTSRALHLTLVIHELATNAVKFGALSSATGRVHFQWRFLEPGRVKFSWREAGGPPVARPRRKGFGSVLVEHSFERARFEHARSGLLCEFELQL